MDLHSMLLSSKITGRINENTEKVDLSDYYTKSQTDGLISTKVDKISGMGLSENNFTNAEKLKLSELGNYDDSLMQSIISEISEQTAFNSGALEYKRKNLLKITVPPKDNNGITFSIQDGILSLSGTATKNFDSYFPEYSYSAAESESWIRINAKSILSCYGSLNSLSVCYYKPDVEHIFENITFRTITNSSPLTLEKGSIIIGIYIRISANKDYTGKNISVMIRYAEITDDTFEPYKPSVLEYISALTTRISALENKGT